MVTRFGAYEILYELKAGGMGAVLLAKRRGPGNFEQLVAIKTIRTEYAGVKAVREMFLDEATILARLNHPGVATVHDFGEEAGTLYMVMEYVAGISFRELLELDPPPLITARAVVDAARGLHAAHELHDLGGSLLGLVHRDISPDNLMLGFDGHVKVIDFGIAIVKNRQAPVTEFGTVKGKPAYMSPEQVKNEPIDRRSDVFSLAIVLWEMLTGRPLFDGDMIYAIVRAVEHQAITPPSQAMAESGLVLPAGLDAVVMNALERDVERRTPSAAAFAEQLEQVLQASGGESLEAWADRELRARRDAHRTWLASVAAGRDANQKAVGRATGEITEVGDLARARTAAVSVTPGAQEPPASTSIGGEDAGSFAVPRRLRLAPLMILVLAMLAAGTVAFLVLHSHEGGARRETAVRRDAAIDVSVPSDIAVVLPPPVIDAEPPPVDAALEDAALVDAGHHRVHVDAGRPRDAAPVVTLDAPAQPAGVGFVNITPKPGGPYVNVVIDGKGAGPAPMLHHKIDAGHHTIQLVDPKTGEIVDTQTIDVTDGKSVSVVQH